MHWGLHHHDSCRCPWCLRGARASANIMLTPLWSSCHELYHTIRIVIKSEISPPEKLLNEVSVTPSLDMQMTPGRHLLTHWGRVTHICVAYLTIIASDNGLSPSRRQAIIWTNAGILLIRPLGTYFNEIFIEIHTFSCKKMYLKMSSAKRRTFCLGLNVLK